MDIPHTKLGLDVQTDDNATHATGGFEKVYYAHNEVQGRVQERLPSRCEMA